mgnify:FL=1
MVARWQGAPTPHDRPPIRALKYVGRMVADPRAWFAGRPPGVSSRLTPGGGTKSLWQAEYNVAIELPVVLDLVEIDPTSGDPVWWVAATVDLRDRVPTLTHVFVGAEGGLDPVLLQREFRWLTPVEVVTRMVPRLIAEGTDPFNYNFPATGHPEASSVDRMSGRQLSNEFLEDVAREYLAQGRGYAAKMAAAHQVSERTAKSWVEKARRRGILTKTRPGSKGGEWVPKSRR